MTSSRSDWMKQSKLSFTSFLFVFSILFVHLLHATEPPSTEDRALNIYYVTWLGEHLLSTPSCIYANQDNSTKPFHHFKQACERLGHHFYLCSINQLKLHVKKADYIFVHNMPSHYDLILLEAIDPNLSKKLIVIVTEPPHVYPLNHQRDLGKFCYKILTWDDRIVDNQLYFKRFFVQSNLTMIANIPPFSEKKLCTLICGNKYFAHPHELYTKRRELIDYFTQNHPHDFMFYGMGWESSGINSYGGVVESKTEIMKHYKFCVCYENIEKLSGYITEKIFGSFIAGCVPIYWGAENIQDYIPKECFIDRRAFASNEELDHYISHMEEEEYQKYLDNIRLFLQSEKAHPFSIDYFVISLFEAMNLSSPVFF